MSKTAPAKTTKPAAKTAPVKATPSARPLAAKTAPVEKISPPPVPKADPKPVASAAAEVAETPKTPVREALPAHFVRDVVDGGTKLATIGETTFDLGKYFVSDVKTPSGRRTIDVNDATAEKLRGLPLDEVYAMAAEACEVTVASLKAKYAELNPGMQRMNLGNRIRGAASAKEQAKAKADKKAAHEAKLKAAQEAKAEKDKAAAEAKAKKA